MQAKTIIMKDFKKQLDGDYTDVDLIFGIKGLDKANVKWWDPHGVGEPIWDTAFDIADPRTQQALLGLS